MIVVDASAWVTSFIDQSSLGDAARDVLDDDRVWAAPAHAPVEVLRTLRRFERAGHLEPAVAAALAHRVAATKVRYSMVGADGLAWVWAHRQSLSMYDAPYVHLAARLEVPLVTLDVRLAHGARALGVTAVIPGEDVP